MKQSILIILFFTFLLTDCQQEKDINYSISTTYTLHDISYGNDSKQKMDIYLPANRDTNNTKVFVLIHGGSWVGGDKSNYSNFFNYLKGIYPQNAIININYRLANSGSPGYPKQINDIQLALNEIQLPKYTLSKKYFFIGTSAGAHLALLYGYGFDEKHYVKGISNTIGPVDFTDTAYVNHPDNQTYMSAIANLIGTVLYSQNSTLYQEVSPVKHITSLSPKTISFYGDSDPLIPNTQQQILQKALNANGVYNETTIYHGGHGGWNETQTQDVNTKLINFINSQFQ